MLFRRDISQTYGPATDRESTFKYLQRSSKTRDVQRRQWIEDWFSKFPTTKKESLKSRLKDKNEKTFQSALFELQCYHILTRLGLSVEVEPDLPNTNKKIDFCVIPPNDKSQHFYVESTISGYGQGILAPTRDEHDAIRRIKQGITDNQKGQKLHSSISLKTEGKLTKNLSNQYKNSIVKQITEFLNDYTPDQIYQYCRQGWLPHTRPFKPYEESDWTIEACLEPPTNPSEGGKIYNPSRTAATNGLHHLSASLEKKARHWNNFDFTDHPFLIAINICDSDFFWNTDIRKALFDETSCDKQNTNFRKELRRINGIIVFEHAVLGNEFTARVQLFKNGNVDIPECFHPLFKEQKLGNLLGIQDN